MMVLHARNSLRSNPAECSLRAALQSLLAYGQGLEACTIDVSVEDGRVILSGEVSSLDAFETAIAVAEVFSGRTVVPDLAIRPSRSTRLIVPPGAACPLMNTSHP